MYTELWAACTASSTFLSYKGALIVKLINDTEG
jgi:hypothetical protein